MKHTIFLFSQILFGTIAIAKGSHGAHEHGKAKLNIAFDATRGVIEFVSPAMSIYGFEHAPKDEKQVKERDTAVERLKNEISKFVVFDPKHSCKITVKNLNPLEQEHHTDHAHAKDKSSKKSHSEHSEHGELHAEYVVECQTNPGGSKLKVSFWDAFPHLESIDVQVVNEKNQVGKKVSKKDDTVSL